MQGRQHHLGFDLADAGKIVFQHTLFGGHLGADFQMLHRTAAAAAKILAARLGALRAGLEDGDGVGRVVFGVLAVYGDFGALARQRAVDEGDLAVDACDPVALVVEGKNVDDGIHGVEKALTTETQRHGEH